MAAIGNGTAVGSAVGSSADLSLGILLIVIDSLPNEPLWRLWLAQQKQSATTTHVAGTVTDSDSNLAIARGASEDSDAREGRYEEEKTAAETLTVVDGIHITNVV